MSKLTIDAILRTAPLIPVLTIDGKLDPVALAETLVASGLPVMEVTLRTPRAAEAIRAMSRIDGAIVGAGTVLDAAQLDEAIGDGARFIVSPGLTDKLARAAIEAEIPFLPGVATASDIMNGLDFGLTHFKFFPAEASGIAALRALAAPFAMARFCPTGGIGRAGARAWLEIPSVLCIGASWPVPSGESDLGAVAERARDAVSLLRPGV